jgi:hypothetical protein
MPKYNRQFDLTIADIDLIETALQQKIRRLSQDRMALMAADKRTASAFEEDTTRLAGLTERLAEIHDLLGRLHNQKTFYRPNASAETAYVSG